MQDDFGYLLVDETQKFVRIPSGQMAPNRYLFAVTIQKEPTVSPCAFLLPMLPLTCALVLAG